ncbi:MAG TPA: hypothetical protein VJQ82_21140 [Terriglobales bacterium]|nr:hypothetical protein [Terriglobales bacterium]
MKVWKSDIVVMFRDGRRVGAVGIDAADQKQAKQTVLWPTRDPSCFASLSVGMTSTKICWRPTARHEDPR